MQRSLHVIRFITASLGMHVLIIAAAVYFAHIRQQPLEITPVNVVELPREVLKDLPRLERPAAVPAPLSPVVPPRPVPPSAVPTPSRFGESDAVDLPRTTHDRGLPDGSDRGTAPSGKGEGSSQDRVNPLPFLSQADIDTLARKGMPEKRPGDESVTLDTDEFKFISYNRWLKIKVESILKYPELAAVSGLQGTLYIKFDIMKDGSLAGLELLKSSGYKILDDEALRAIRNAAPFQPLPDDWKMERYSIRAAVLFYLSEAYIR
ncbi:MAG: energy transducer TonB [Nitrospirota bacterium]|nr:energy transducer TonB [Nitrospirota bacterium]